MNKRPNLHWALLLGCVIAVVWASFLTPRVGRCGSALYFLPRILAGLALSASGISSIQSQAIGLGVARLLTAAVFVTPALVWYRKAPRNWYVAGLLMWTAFYVASYFFFFPVPDCP